MIRLQAVKVGVSGPYMDRGSHRSQHCWVKRRRAPNVEYILYSLQTRVRSGRGGGGGGGGGQL